MRTKPSEKMLKARNLRLARNTLEQIAEKIGVSRQGARYLLKMSDRFFVPAIGDYRSYKRYVSARKQSLSAS